MTYRDVARRLELPPPGTIHQTTGLIEELMRRHARAGSPQLASLVVGRARGGMPAPGFFLLLGELGLYDGSPDGPDARAFHEALVRRCFDAAKEDAAQQ